MTKLIAKILLLVILLGSCFAFVGCSYLFRPRWFKMNTKFSVTIEGVKQQKEIDFEITDDLYICINVFGVNDAEPLADSIQFEYNKENTFIKYAFSSRGKLYYNLYLYELGNDNELKITYAGKTISAKYNVLDYDFEANGYYAPNSIDDLDKYPAFKEMLLSIKYHEFKEPYIGLNEWQYYIRDDELIYDYFSYTNKNDNPYMSTDYLVYLTDSVYYPEKFIGYNMYMYLPKGTDLSEGAGRSTMDEFWLTLTVSDPKHNKRSDSITGMSFSPYNKDKIKYWQSDEYINPQVLRLERYRDKYFQYQMGELTIYILSTKNSGAKAYFTYGDYFYVVSASYDFD